MDVESVDRNPLVRDARWLVPGPHQLLNPGREALEQALRERLDQQRFEDAEQLLPALSLLGADDERRADVRAAIDQARLRWKDDQRARFDEALAQGRFEHAEAMIAELVALGLAPDDISELRDRLDDARQYGGRQPGSQFQERLPGDSTPGPVMVVIPAGSFLMGSDRREPGHIGHEWPRHRVRFARGFALARNETTVGQFGRFIAETGYVTDAEKAGAAPVYLLSTGRIARHPDISWREDYSGRPADDELPVIHVSWNDAVAYASWLAERTGAPYRLPSEAEFEYALRAGTASRYWWGDAAPSSPTENVTGGFDRLRGDRRWRVAFEFYRDDFWGPAPVGSLAANPFGLYDMGGNVMEWVADCWHDSYGRAPADGSAWVNPGCPRRVLRGGSWSATPDMSRSAYRLAARTDSTDPRAGFRVARDL
ncbi:MAG: SUMF1/EgtB/PvdO family nonheme iron enzyme [Wenzhouxiangellaceae bacterium]|nr:SUMF1/EgtB/PvdO family nonheme iron enzyme [Wenzhouxiangellaceae bacterium]